MGPWIWISKIFAIFARQNGAWAGRLGTGLQNQLERFNSARHLKAKGERHALLFYKIRHDLQLLSY